MAIQQAVKDNEQQTLQQDQKGVYMREGIRRLGTVEPKKPTVPQFEKLRRFLLSMGLKPSLVESIVTLAINLSH
jgi:hypothetical protein